LNIAADQGRAVRPAVVLCTDRNMLMPALFVAQSVRLHAAVRQAFDIVIVTDPAAATEAEKRWMADLGIRHHVEDFGELASVITLSGRLTTATLVKLTLARIFADRYDRILYLDTDLTIHRDVTGLFDLDLEGRSVAAQRRGFIWLTPEEKSRGEAHFAALGMSEPYWYFNTGVLLIDVPAWNRLDLTARTLDFVRRNPELCLLPDEDGLNATLDGNFSPISPIWNMAPRRLWMMRLHDVVEPVIVHYSGEDKPWRRFGTGKTLFPDGQASGLYRSFINQSPFPDWLRTQWTWHDLRRSAIHDLKRGWNRLSGRGNGLSRRQIDDYVNAFRAHCANGRFVDVEQGLSAREDGQLRLCRAAKVSRLPAMTN
jgi:lipopolysaccharide biosynthesis glycosyltransferase